MQVLPVLAEGHQSLFSLFFFFFFWALFLLCALCVWLTRGEDAATPQQKGLTLTENEYVRTQDELTGEYCEYAIDVLGAPGAYFAPPFSSLTDVLFCSFCPFWAGALVFPLSLTASSSWLLLHLPLFF